MKILNLKNTSFPDAVRISVKAFKKGGVIIFPTETVYGIGADAFDRKAVKQIFVLKKRPKEMPFQILISDIRQVRYLARNVSKKAQALMKKNWPGPLTIILKKKTKVSDTVTAGLETVGIRMPDNEFILEVIKKLGRPIAASSANISGRKPPKTAKEAAKNFKSGVKLIIDGGRCRIGKASKVVFAASKEIKVIRK